MGSGHLMRKATALLVCLGWLLSGRGEGAESPTAPAPREVLAAYKAACEAITSFDLHVRLETRGHLMRVARQNDTKRDKEAAPPQYQVVDPQQIERDKYVRQSRQYFSEGKFRADLLESEGKSLPRGSRPLLWDGSTAKTFDAGAKRGTVRAVFMEPVAVYGVSYPNLYRSYDVDFTYAQLFETRAPESLAVRREGALLVLSAPAKEKANARGAGIAVELHLDPERGFLPARIDIATRRQGETVPWVRFENQLEEVQPGLWAPVRSVKSILVTDKGSPMLGRTLGTETLEVDQSRSSFNTAVDSALFTLDFPPGTEVYDQVRNVRYIAGAQSKEAHLDHLARLGRLSAEKLEAAAPRDRMTADVGPPAARRWLLGVTLASAACLLGLLAYACWKRRLPLLNRGGQP